MQQKTAQDILQKIKSAYTEIADEFDLARKNLWPELGDFLQYVKEGDKILDAGCGNGRLTQLFEEKNIGTVDYIGVDNSEDLLALAQKNYPDKKFFLGDLLSLPFQDESFDVVFSIAALHHIPSVVLRKKAMLEMHRVLKKGGTLILTNWDRWQKQYLFLLFKYSALKLFGLSKMDWKDISIPWQNRVLRYYHCFTLRELDKLAKSTGFDIIKSYKAIHGKNRNLVIIAKKI